MIIPFQELSPEALQGVIEEFITREGTDYGETEYSLADKVDQIKQQLSNRQAFILFDEITQRCNIVSKEQLDQLNP